MLLDPFSGSWSANGEHIARLRERDGADPTLAILWATYLYGRMTSEPGDEPLDRQAADAVEAEIEGLVFEHLAGIRSRGGLLFLPAADDGLARGLAVLADRTSAHHVRRAIAYLHYRVAPYFRSADQWAGPRPPGS